MWNICGKTVSLAMLLVVAGLGTLGCKNEPSSEKDELAPLEFSRNLRLGEVFGESVAEVRSFVGRDTLVRKFVLRKAGTEDRPLPQGLVGATVLQVPLKRVVPLSSAQIGYLLRLGLQDRIVAVGEGKYIADSALYARFVNSEVAEIGYGTSMSLEKLVALAPDLVMNFATGGGHDDYERIGALGLPLMLTSEWQEESPLAKMEWIKLYGWLFGVEALADSVFGQSKSAYLRASGSDSRVSDSGSPCPRVIVGMSYGGVWYAPGGNSFTARLIRDAGGCYLWASDTSRELQLSLEEVMLVADSADVWVNPGMFATPQEILAAEPRASHIRAFREKRVCQNDGRKGPGGGNDFFESAVAYPAELIQNLEKCLLGATNGPDSSASGLEWYHNIFIF